MRQLFLFIIFLAACCRLGATPLDSIVAYPSWQTLSVPAKLQLSSPVKNKFSGQLTMKRGQWLTISVRMLGMEVAVLTADKDSVFAVDKFHKLYVSESTTKVLGGFPASITDVQRLLLGQLFILADPSQEISVEEYEEMLWGLPVNNPSNVNYGFQLSPDSDPVPEALAVAVSGFQPVTVSYTDFYDTPCGPVAGEADFSAFLGNAIMQASLTLNFEKARYNRPFDSPGLPNLKGYKRRDLKEFLKSAGIN